MSHIIQKTVTQAYMKWPPVASVDDITVLINYVPLNWIQIKYGNILSMLNMLYYDVIILFTTCKMLLFQYLHKASSIWISDISTLLKSSSIRLSERKCNSVDIKRYPNKCKFIENFSH